jgi:tRNA (guanine37-N1)-methyltransferase
MWCGVITLFPEMFQAITEYGITSRAVKRGLLELNCWNPRDFAEDNHKTVDDRPYGGGPGMLMSVYPLRDAILACKQACKKAAKGTAKTIYLSPQGKRLDFERVKAFSKEESIIFVAGRYEGIDERLIELEIDEECSIGDYVLSGGELAVMVAIDAITRLLPGVLNDEASSVEDSFVDGLLDCPHYTRPEEVAGLKVPSVLLSGDHAAIERWRLKQKLGRTFERRPDLLAKLQLTKEQQALLQEYLQSNR